MSKNSGLTRTVTVNIENGDFSLIANKCPVASSGAATCDAAWRQTVEDQCVTLVVPQNTNIEIKRGDATAQGGTSIYNKSDRLIIMTPTQAYQVYQMLHNIFQDE